MKVFSIKRMLLLLTVLVFTAVGCFTVQEVWAAGSTQTTKATTKAAKKPKTVKIDIIINSATDAEVDLIIEKKSKDKKSTGITKTVSLKKGMNYFTYDKGKKGNYSVSMIAFGDTVKQEVTAVQGTYTMFFSVAPPQDGDKDKTKPVVYQDITKLK